MAVYKVNLNSLMRKIFLMLSIQIKIKGNLTFQKLPLYFVSIIDGSTIARGLAALLVLTSNQVLNLHNVNYNNIYFKNETYIVLKYYQFKYCKKNYKNRSFLCLCCSKCRFHC